jgi:hypothetical protein
VATSDIFLHRRVTCAADLFGRAATGGGWVEVDDHDVPDPGGQSRRFHHEVAEMVDRDCTSIARALVGALLSDVSPH